MGSRTGKRVRVDPVVRAALAITTPEQARRGDLKLVDVSNHSDADQRHMVRSGEKQTVRRQTHIERLRWLEDRELAACQWYADAYEARYSTLGTTAKYGDHRGGSVADFHHLPKTADQESAGYNFSFAREGICPTLRPMFERVVIHGFEMDGGARLLFRLAARQVMHRIEGVVGL